MPAPQTTFVPPHSTVVLLAGLPGDVENETRYRDQIQDWLNWVHRLSGRPKHVYVFWDAPNSLAPAEDLPIHFLPANRTAFLNLSRELSNSTNPVVVVVWGHGGMQREIPVFHVRGPRLTPDDMKSFADSLKESPSQWLLFFSGSGRFARELIAQHRQILSSEHNNRFSSDPIGLPLLQSILRTHASNTFASVSRQLGREVVQWYESRRLVRQEEPTLWLAGSEPELLAPSDQAMALLLTGGTPGPALAEPPKRLPPLEPPPVLAAGWKDVARVDPHLYANWDAVVLHRQVRYTLGQNPALLGEHEEFLQILTLEGKPYGDFELAFMPPDEELDLLECEVLRPDNTLIRLEPNHIRETSEPTIGDYPSRQWKFFSLPGVEPGAVAHLRYRRQWRRFPLPHTILSLPLAGDLPVVESTIQITVPKESAFHFALEHTTPVDPQIQQSLHGSLYSWTFKNLEPIPPEALAPPAFRPMLHVSTFPDWASYKNWYDRIRLRTDDSSPELQQKALELAGDAGSDRDKLRALYNYVTGLRYVAVPLGVNSYRPRAAAQVFRNQFGDCKDKANLFNTMARSLGFEAFLVLAPRFGQASESLPGLGFNHAFSLVTLHGEPLWMDLTDDVCRFGLLPPGDMGRNVLVMDDQPPGLTRLPSPTAKDHRLEIVSRVICHSATEPLQASWRGITAGHPDYEFRLALRGLKGHAHNLPLLGVNYRPVTGAFSLEKKDTPSVSNLEDDFSWNAQGRWLGLVSRQANQWLLRAPFWVPKEWDPALHRRSTPLFLHQGYPLTLVEKIELVLPATAHEVALPATRENIQDPLRWKIAWTQSEDRNISAYLYLELVAGELPLSQVPAYQQQLGDLLTYLTIGAMFKTEL